MYLCIGGILYKQEFHNLWALIQKMSHNGVYVMCENNEAITDQDLIIRKPFNLVCIIHSLFHFVHSFIHSITCVHTQSHVCTHARMCTHIVYPVVN